MKIDGMTIVQGSKGSGKSAMAVAVAIKHLKAGGVVAANFKLADGWADVIAKRHFMSFFSDKFRYEYASSMYRRFFVVQSLAAIKAIDVLSLAEGRYKTVKGKYQEGQGLLLLDESQLIFNSRACMTGDKNLGWIEFFTQARKLGWIEILIAHKLEMLDSQIRDIAEYESRFRNLQKVRFPVLGFPLVPFPVFFLINRYAGLGPGSGCVHSKELCPLPLWAARLYDSKLVFRQSNYSMDTLPHYSGKSPSPLPGGGGGAARVRVSSLSGPHWDNFVMTRPGACLDRRSAAPCVL